MRIIHTSDWHLGQHFMGRNRQDEHRAFLDWLVDEIKERKADGLVVAGDIFDTGAPPSYARALYNEFIVSLRNTNCRQTLILGGNHDAAATLNEARSILQCLNTRVVAGIFETPKDHVIVFKDSRGNPGLIACAIPFLRPRDLVKSLGGQSGRDKQRAVGDAIQAFYTRVFEAAEAEKKRLGPLPIMATGHLTVVGGKSSESVRDIYIGSLDAFPGKGFPPADYIALGHLHRGQQIRGFDHIRYSGSPIPLSFDEGETGKQVLQVDFRDGTLESVTPVAVPCFRRLKSFRGSLEEIEQKIRGFKDVCLESEGAETAWLEAQVSDDHYLTDLQERIQTVIEEVFGGENGPELLRVRRKRLNKETGETMARERLEELSPGEVFSRRLDQEEISGSRAETMTRLFNRILEQVEGQ